MGKSRVSTFDRHHRRYDDWFERHAAVYQSELLAVRALLPWQGRGLAIGVGTARFAAPLGIQVGIDPSSRMLHYARRRGVSVVRAVAEALPFASWTFDHVLCVTTICFVADIPMTLAEAHRVLKPDAPLVIGFVDRDSAIGRSYLARQAESLFYREATFVTSGEVASFLCDAGFGDAVWLQTLFQDLDATDRIEPPRSGSGAGAFVVVRAIRQG